MHAALQDERRRAQQRLRREQRRGRAVDAELDARLGEEARRRRRRRRTSPDAGRQTESGLTRGTSRFQAAKKPVTTGSVST
jgi:hypothetical protein